MLTTMKNIVGGGDGWATNLDGSTQIKTLAANDTSVQFTNVVYNDNYGYDLWVFTETSSTPNTEPPKKTKIVPTITSTGGGLCTISYPITKVTSAQAGATCKLRIVK